MQNMKAVRRAGRAVSTAKRNRLSVVKQRAMLQQLEPVRGIEKIVITPTGQAHPSIESVPGFVNLNFGPNIVKAIEETGIHKPTVIQMLAAPAILNGNHVLCGAETGSGKTLAYLAPVMHQLKHEEETIGMMARINRPRAIILCPSRELASQVLGVAKSLCHDARLRIVGIIGGKKKRIIQESLYSPVDIAVATLSTLLRYLRRGKISLADLTHLVIDEADTMFDESFIQDLKGVLKDVKVRTSFPPTLPVDDTQIIVVTATVSSELEKKVNMVVPNIRVVTTRSLHKVLPNIRQVFLKVRQDEKGDKLVELLRAHNGPHYKTIVFCNTVKSCTWAAKHLAANGIPVAKYHGGIHPVIHKQRPLQDFISDDQSVLVCTDIASRGIDCSKINHVIQYDFPTSVTDYLHRVGRTGRVGGVTQCLATTLMTKKKDVRVALKIERAANKKAPIADEELVSKKNNKRKLVVNDGKKRDNLKHPT